MDALIIRRLHREVCLLPCICGDQTHFRKFAESQLLNDLLMPVRSEMFMALKSGMVDGEDNGVINLVAGSNLKVIKHFSPINWNRSGVAAWISEHNMARTE